jgi:hypothetical protein
MPNTVVRRVPRYRLRKCNFIANRSIRAHKPTVYNAQLNITKFLKKILKAENFVRDKTCLIRFKFFVSLFSVREMSKEVNKK